MTIQSTPVTIQSGGETAEQFRRMFWSQMNGRPGIISSGDLAVSQNGTPNMSVNVADGRAFVAGDESSVQGLYFIENRNTTNLVISASHATLGRYDLVVVRVRDAAYSGGTNSAALEVVTGTPASSPADPSVPSNCFVLARVVVAAASSTVTNAFIAVVRTGARGYTAQGGRASGLGGTIVCTSSFRPTVNLYEGLFIYETDTDRVYVYNGSAWARVGAIGARLTYTPTWTQSATISKTTVRNEYSYIDREVAGVVFLTATSGGTASNTIQVTRPVTPAWTSNQVIGSGTYSNGSANFPIIVWQGTSGFVFVPAFTASTNFFGTQALFYTSGASANTSFTPTVASGHSLIFDYHYEAAAAAAS